MKNFTSNKMIELLSTCHGLALVPSHTMYSASVNYATSVKIYIFLDILKMCNLLL